MWITAFLCGGVGLILGARLAVRGVLLSVSGILGVAMFVYSIFFAIVILGSSNGSGYVVGILGCVFCFFPALCSFLAFCLLLARQIQRKSPFPSCLFGFFVVNAFFFTVVFGIQGFVSPFLFLFALPFWACVVLAWRLRGEWMAVASAVPPPLPFETIPEEKDEPGGM